MSDVQIFKTPYAEITLIGWEGQLVYLGYTSADKLQFHPYLQSNFAPFHQHSCAVLEQAKEQLTNYFSGALQVFDLPVWVNGTDFQRRVWDALKTIPYGETRSYSEIAARIEHPKAVRAVGSANGRNPVSLIVPCHRVINAGGGLGGYAGGLKFKEWLLNHEKEHLSLT